MKQVIQSARTGKLALREVPEPKVRAGHLLVRTRASLISAGTERMVVDFARKSLAGKARARPDLVKKVIGKARRDGLAATVQAVMARLDEPLPLGYSAAGEVVAVGAGLEGAFHVGERVAVAGAGLANHAELNVVPRALAATMPPGIGDEEAAFGTLAAIALHAVRNLGVGLGDVVAVLGAGLVGQLAVQLLGLAGARVLALDYDTDRLDLAGRLGAEATADLAAGGTESRVTAMTAGRGCDAVLIAAASQSSEPFETAAAVARDRARVCLVGMTGTAFPYAEFMKKELEIVVSRSYGPGRYDPDFESRGTKYPEGWVRWTESENLAECLRLIAPARSRRLEVAPLITHRYALDKAEAAYAMITGQGERHLGVVLSYPDAEDEQPRPAFADPEITAVLVATRHDTHAEFTARALEAGKAVLVEKPLALDREQLNRVIEARNTSEAFFQIGFNRRFAPLAVQMRDRLADAGAPRFVVLRINAGPIPAESWIQAADEGGGRILGEVCHFVDLARFLIGSPIASVLAEGAAAAAGPCDDVSATIRFADGSLATIAYTALGDTIVGKERIEAYGGGAVITIDNFRAMTIAEGGKLHAGGRRGQDKGFAQSLGAFVRAVTDGGRPAIDEAELIETSLATLAVMDSLRTGERIEL